MNNSTPFGRINIGGRCQIVIASELYKNKPYVDIRKYVYSDEKGLIPLTQGVKIPFPDFSTFMHKLNLFYEDGFEIMKGKYETLKS